MLKSIFNLFGRSPFASLQAHMDKVKACVELIPRLFDSLIEQDYASAEKIGEKIAEIEHQADLIKNDIRNHLPKTLYLPIEKNHLLEILSLQDAIADKAEDIAVLTTVRSLVLPQSFKPLFLEFLHKNIECYENTFLIIKELHQLIESSFGGIEAEKVRLMVEEVSFKEHEVDVIQKKLLKSLLDTEKEMSYGTFYLWQKIFESIAEISNLSEKLAFRVRMTLELK